MKTTIKTLIAAVFASIMSVANINATTNPDAKPFAASLYQVANTMSVRLAINKNSDAKVKVTLKDEYGNVLYVTQIGKKETTFRCNVDMSQLSNGKYQLSISDGTTTETKEVVLGTKQPEPANEIRFISMN